MSKIARYTQNMSFGGITEAMQEKIINSKVVVMGVGGLGSGVTMNLAAMGVGQIKLVDDKILVEEDFNRQLIHKFKNIGRSRVLSAKGWIQEFNPEIKVEVDNTSLNELNYFNVIQGYDIIVDCFDEFDKKYLLNEIAFRHKKILVHASVKGMCGQVTTFAPGKTGCLACIFEKPQVFKKEEYPSFSSVVNTIAALEAQEVFKVITGCAKPLLNQLLTYDGEKSEFKTILFSENNICEVCSNF